MYGHRHFHFHRWVWEPVKSYKVAAQYLLCTPICHQNSYPYTYMLRSMQAPETLLLLHTKMSMVCKENQQCVKSGLPVEYILHKKSNIHGLPIMVGT